MKAVVVASPGGYDKLVIAEIADPNPGSDEVVIDVAFAGCNWGDTQMRRGNYSFPVQYPIVPGYEVAGTVAAVGAHVRDVLDTDEVIARLDAGRNAAAA